MIIKSEQSNHSSQSLPKGHRQSSVNQSKLNADTCCLPVAWKACASESRLDVSVTLTSDWTRKWREFFKPFAKRSSKHEILEAVS